MVTQAPVFVSQILAVLSKEPVAIRSLNYTILPKRIIESEAINDLLMACQSQDFRATFGIPKFAGSVITSGYKPKFKFLLHVTAFVKSTISQWLMMSLELLEYFEVLVFICEDFILEF